jgi:xanthine dehydrogenase/oxidase
MTDGASVGSELMVEAATLACNELLDRLKPLREQLQKEKPGVTLTWQEVTARGFGPMPTDTRVLMSATGFYTQPKTGGIDQTPSPIPWWDLKPSPPLWKYFSCSAACSEVEVDCLTGEVSVLRADILFDVGTSLNPVLDFGQAEGGYVFGVGHYLREEPLMDPTTGENKCDGTWEYKPPSNHCVPLELNVNFVKDSSNTESLYGSKGIGEPPLLLAFSIVSALRKAIVASRVERGLSGNGFVLDIPATCDRVQTALELRRSDFVGL